MSSLAGISSSSRGGQVTAIIGSASNLHLSPNSSDFSFNIFSTVTTPLNTNAILYGIAYSSTLNRFVAVGNGSTHTIAYSNDGINWTGLGKTIFDSSGYGIAYNGTYWVAVGSGSTHTIAYSTDGITWTGLGRTIFNGTGYGIAYGGSYWVAGGGGNNSIAYATDPTTIGGSGWVGLGRTIFSSTGYGISYGGSYWVAGGNGTNSIAYATTPTSIGGSGWVGLGTTLGSIFRSVAFGNSYWVAVGANTTNTLVYASNPTSIGGTGWVGLGTSILTGNAFAITYGGSYWVAVGNMTSATNSIAYASDPTTVGGSGWVNLTNSKNITGANSYSIIYVSTLSKFYLGGTSSSVTTGFLSASNPTTIGGSGWVILGTVNNTSAIGGCYAVAYSSILNRWVLGGPSTYGYVLAYSSNPGNYQLTGAATTSLFSSYANTVVYSPTQNIWVAGGVSSPNSLAYSTDGITWTGLGVSLFSGVNGIAYSPNQNIWVAVGYSTNTVAYATDPTTIGGSGWVGLGTSLFSSTGYSVAYSSSQNLWVAVGQGTNKILYATDPTTIGGNGWTNSTTGTNLFSSVARGIGYSPTLNRWVSVGNGTANKVGYSNDGINWTGLGNIAFTSYGNIVTWDVNKQRFLAVGSSSVATAFEYSNDGITWASITNYSTNTSNVTTVATNYSIFNTNTLKLWLDAYNSSSFVLSGSNITTWKDLSGYGNNATGVSNPTYDSTNKVVTLSGSNYFTSSLTLPSQTYSIFVVCNPTSSSTCGVISFDNGTNYIDFPYNNGNFVTSYDSTALNKSNGLTTNITTGSFQLIEVIVSPTTQQVYNRGVLQSSSSQTLTSGTSPSLVIGYTNGSSSFTGTIKEILIYNTTLTPFQQIEVEQYLIVKWGL
jgi:hypothetical protein